MGLIAALNFPEGISSSQNLSQRSLFCLLLLPLLLWPSLRLKPVITATTLDSTVTTVDFLVMVTNKTGPVPVLMDFHPHAGAAVARDPLMLMLNLDITVMDLTDTTLDLTDMVFLDVALPTLEVTTWERDLLKLMLNPDITVMDLTDTTLDLTDILMDIVLMDVVLLLTLPVTLSPTEASKDSASKCAKSGVF